MSRHTGVDLDAVLRELDPAGAVVTEEERHRATGALEMILATPHLDRSDVASPQRRRPRGRALVAAGFAAVAAIAVPTILSGGSAFASWTATPEPLAPAAAAAAADTCQSALGFDDRDARTVMSERRGGWTFVRIEGSGGEGSCLMPEDFVNGSSSRTDGFFGTYDPDPPTPPTPARDAIAETGSMAGSVSLPGRLSLGTVDGWFSWVNGYAGSDVSGVTVHPPTGPDVEASVSGGRFSAWWPAGEARGDNPGVGGAWTYTLTLSDGTSRDVALQQDTIAN